MPTSILVAAALAALVVVVDAVRPGAYGEPGRQFQSLVRGLGLGSQVDLAHCNWQFDPRLGIDPGTEMAGSATGTAEPWCAMSLFVVPHPDVTAPDTPEE